MADNSWRGLELWERVKWARARKFKSAAEAAGALDMLEGTYRCYERGPDSAKYIKLDYKYARRFANLFNVRWEWLLDDVGEPWLTDPEEEEEEQAAAERSGLPGNLRRWREFRGFTVAELAKKSGLGAQTIAGLESGKTDIPTKLLTPLARALGAEAGFLLDVNPYETDPAFFESVRAIPKERRVQALEILKTFRATPPKR
jgi:transcriptional regulator with XRE-family HTH domain